MITACKDFNEMPWFSSFLTKIAFQLTQILSQLSEANINFLSLNPESIWLDFRGNNYFELAVLKNFSCITADSDFEVKIKTMSRVPTILTVE